jgi:hypothetical protein
MSTGQLPCAARQSRSLRLLALFRDLPAINAATFRADQERYADREARFDRYERARRPADHE